MNSLNSGRKRPFACCVFLALAGGATVVASQNNNITTANPTQRPKSKKVTVSKLQPSVDTEAVLSEAWLTTDGDGHMKVDLAGPLAAGQVDRVFWLVNPVAHTYHIVRLTDNDEQDSRKIDALYRQFGVVVSQAGLVTRLSANRSEAIKRQQDMLNTIHLRQGALEETQANESCMGGPSAVDADAGTQWGDTCLGRGFADVQTWELARVLGFDVEHLNETSTTVNWRHTVHSWGGEEFASSGPTGGDCWANPDTFIHTHWFVLNCIPTANFDYRGFDVATTGFFMNSDFPTVIYNLLGLYFPPVNTYVTATPAVDWAYGQPNWGAQFIIDSDGRMLQWLEENFFLTGVRSGFALEDGGCSTFCDPSDEQIRQCENQVDYHHWDLSLCECVLGASPIILDLDGNGLKLTSAADGVTFDIMADGQPVTVAWTRPDRNEAFLVLDRNHNGTIDSGAELFGNFTDQPAPVDRFGRNGFRALAVFDQPDHGGNGDGQITEDDAIYSELRLWVDANHDGISQPDELKTLAECGVRAISLRYVVSKRTDEFGNLFRFRSHVTMDASAFEHGRFRRQATDVYLTYIR